MNWMFLPYKRYADFKGRSRRKEYWMFVLFYMIVFTVLYGFMFASMAPAMMEAAEQAQMGMEPTAPSGGMMAGTGIAGILLFIFSIGSLIPQLAVIVRRLHDQDKSGWLVLLGFIPIANLILLVFMFMEGTNGPNQYGPDPKAGEPGHTA